MNTTILWITGIIEAFLFGYQLASTFQEISEQELDEGQDWNGSITQTEFYKGKNDGQE